MTGSPYAPLKSGKLRKIILVLGGSAATALVDGTVTAKLESPLWGVPVTVSKNGNGLQTVPFVGPDVAEMICDVPVQIGSNITASILLDTGSTPVTPRIRLIGVFEG